MKRKKRRRLKKSVVIVFMLMFLIAILFSCFKIIDRYLNLKSNDRIKKVIEETIDIEKVKDEDYIIDFEYLKGTNSDIVAYLQVDNTLVDYLVVKGNDNSYYLNHNINKERNVAGWIFIDYKNKLDGSDQNIVIYGHNMVDGSMFGSLYQAMKKEWYENIDNHSILLITESERVTYQIFSIYSIMPEDYYINTEFNDVLDYQEFLNTIKDRSIYKSNLDLSTDDQVLTLSTCNLSGDKRVVIHAKKVNSISY